MLVEVLWSHISDLESDIAEFLDENEEIVIFKILQKLDTTLKDNPFCLTTILYELKSSNNRTIQNK